ncbi:MAG: hypothetical protein AAF380_01060 [Bacteroidota bacterium]
MKYLRKSTYLLLASHILAVAPLYTAPYPPLPDWLQQEITQLIAHKEEYEFGYQMDGSIFEHSLARTLIGYNQARIPWMQPDFWQDESQKQKLLSDIENQVHNLSDHIFESDFIPLSDKFKPWCWQRENTLMAQSFNAWKEECYCCKARKGKQGCITLSEGEYHGDIIRAIFTQDYQVDWAAIPYTDQLPPWSAIITQKRILTDQLPKDPNHSYLYDILTQHTLPYLIGETPSTFTHAKALLKALWKKSGANPYAPVHYTDPTTGSQVSQNPILFLASPNFEKVLRKDLENQGFYARTGLKGLFTDKRKEEEDDSWDGKIADQIIYHIGVTVYDPVEATSTYLKNFYTAALMAFHFDYQDFTLSKAQLAQTPIVIANKTYQLGLPDELAQIIGGYTGLFTFPGINDQDINGHTALDYHPLADDPCHQLLKTHGAVSQSPIKPPISIIGGVFNNQVEPFISNVIAAVPVPDTVQKYPITSARLGLFLWGCLRQS